MNIWIWILIRTLDFGFWIWTLDFGFWILGFKTWTAYFEFGLRNLDFGFKLWVSDLDVGFGIWDLDCQIRSLRSWDLRLRSGVSDSDRQN